MAKIELDEYNDILYFKVGSNALKYNWENTMDFTFMIGQSLAIWVQSDLNKKIPFYLYIEPPHDCREHGWHCQLLAYAFGDWLKEHRNDENLREVLEDVKMKVDNATDVYIRLLEKADDDQIPFKLQQIREWFPEAYINNLKYHAQRGWTFDLEIYDNRKIFHPCEVCSIPYDASAHVVQHDVTPNYDKDMIEGIRENMILAYKNKMIFNAIYRRFNKTVGREKFLKSEETDKEYKIYALDEYNSTERKYIYSCDIYGDYKKQLQYFDNMPKDAYRMLLDIKLPGFVTKFSDKAYLTTSEKAKVDYYKHIKEECPFSDSGECQKSPL